ncbi:MAG: DUF3014 domain-containing protein [Vicinamibacterales bacterium]|nr:DUF3014 domain-containing protein [Vicinamibacterales bacterium]
MTSLDDQPLARTPSPFAGSEPPLPPARPPVVLIVGGIVLLAAIGFGLRWWWSDRAPRDAAAEAPAATAPVAGTEGTLPPEPAAAIELPPLDQMDPFIRGLLGALSARPELARYLATDDLVRHLAVVIDRVARGVSPAGELRMLAPAQPFAVMRRQGRLVVDPAGYQRYDGIVATIDSMDMTALARAYRTIQPRLNEAYRAVAQPGGDVDRAVAEGLAVLIATPVPPDSPGLEFGDGPNYVYVDLALESLDPAQKHLVRMGPAHVRTLTRKLTELRTALARTP